MSVLLKSEIIALASGTTKILGDKYILDNFESCSYDLRVGTVFKGKEIYGNDPQNEFQIIEVKPSEIVTILTHEEVNLPTNILASVFAINKMSSKGFLILNPGHIDPGYKGPISICAINLSNETILLQIGKTAIFTIVFDKLSSNAEPYTKNKTYLTRNERDKDFSIEKGRKLSTSVFDLIKIHDYKDNLNELIKEILYSNENKDVLKRVIDETIYEKESEEKLIKALLWRSFGATMKYLGYIGLLLAILTGSLKLAEVISSKQTIKQLEEKRIIDKDSINQLKSIKDSLLNVIDTIKK